MSLWEMSLSGAVMIVVITLVRALTVNRLPKSTFLALWAVALARLLIPYSLPSALSVYSLFQESAPAAVTAHKLPALPTVMYHAPAAGTVTAPAAPSWGVDIWTVLWWTGMLACALFFAVSYFKCRREFRRSLPVDHAAAQEWLEAHSLRRRIELRYSDRVSTPLTYGILRPVILLPKSADWEDMDSLKYALEHEHVHICRFDALWKLALTVALCVHWFDPLVWVMYVLANRDMELACDEAVVRRFGMPTRAAYALTLIRMEATRSGLAPLCNNFGKNAIEERIVAIMKIKKTSLAALIVAGTLVVGITVAFATSGKPDAQPPAGSELDNPAKATIDAQYITSYVDAQDGKTYYSTDNGQTWQEGDVFAELGTTFDDVEWWTAEEYEAWMEEQKAEYQAMLGEKGWNPTEGWYTWDQKRIDEAIAGNEQLLQEIRDGKMVSKPRKDGDTMIQFSYDPRALDTTTAPATLEAPGSLTATSAEPLSQEELLAEYAKFGISYQDGLMRYNGERVGMFVDGVEVPDGIWTVWYSHTDYRGGLSLVTVRERKDNGDGSYDPFGPLTGIRALTDSEVDELYGISSSNQEAVSSVTAYAIDAVPGDWDWPLDGDYSVTYDSNSAISRVDPLDGTRCVHPGVDIAAPEGTRVKAAADGIVSQTGFDAKKGNFVALSHTDGGSSLYSHLQSVGVDEDTQVTKGDVIGTVGNSGMSTGPHLHFEVNTWNAAADDADSQDGVIQALLDTIAYQEGKFTFRCPDGAEGLSASAQGRAVYADGFSASAHPLELTKLTPGETYQIPWDEAYTELTLDVFADGETDEAASVDLVALRNA